MRLFPHLSVRANLEFGLRQKKLPAKERDARVADVAAKLDLEKQMDRLPNQLSGGQQQRVSLGRALVMRPSVILFDEPLSNLDAKLRDQVRIEIRRIQREYGLTAIYVTHDQAEALAMSDRIVVLNEGRMEQVDTPETIYSRPRTGFVADFIGDANVVEGVVGQTREAGRWDVSTPVGTLLVAADQLNRGSDDFPWLASGKGRARRRLLSPELSRTEPFRGTIQILMITTDGYVHRVQVTESSAKEGDTVQFGIPTDHIIISGGRVMTLRRWLLVILLLLPGLGLILWLMGTVVYIAVAQSFGLYAINGESQLTLAFWSDLFGRKIFSRSIQYSIYIGVLSAIFSVALAYPLAIWLRKPFPGLHDHRCHPQSPHARAWSRRGFPVHQHHRLSRPVQPVHDVAGHLG